ncbi:Uncharacterised protein [Mycobacterium tuberculosis]|nr:Uncharacterised protein [Mycobacterium tuberculosis]
MPPPCRISARLASVCSVDGYDDEFFSGMVSPSLSCSDDGCGGESSSTCCEPSSDVWPILASAFFGSLTLLDTPSVRVAIQFFRLMALIEPT